MARLCLGRDAKAISLPGAEGRLWDSTPSQGLLRTHEGPSVARSSLGSSGRTCFHGRGRPPVSPTNRFHHLVEKAPAIVPSLPLRGDIRSRLSVSLYFNYSFPSSADLRVDSPFHSSWEGRGGPVPASVATSNVAKESAKYSKAKVWHLFE